MYENANVLLKIYDASQLVAVRLIKQPSLPGLASADLLEDCGKLLALFRHRTISSRSPLTPGDLNFKQNRPVPVRCVETPAGRVL